MKKLLLIIASVIAVSATAQTRRTLPAANSQVFSKTNKNVVFAERENASPVTTPRHARAHSAQRNVIGNHINIAQVIDIGSAANAFTCAFGPKTYLWYDKDINSITFSHRTDFIAHPEDVTSGALRFDYSTDGGSTWTNDAGPVYANRDNTHRARYPQGLIYNPTGNTDPGNAYFTNYAPITDGTNWFENVHASSHLTSVDSNWTRETLAALGTLPALIPDGFQAIKNTGIVWNSSQNVKDADVSVNLLYDDGITMSKGTWNGTQFDYVHNTFYAPMSKLSVDTPLYAGHTMAWSDDGMIGYVSILGDNMMEWTGDSMYYLINYKTTDGGATWRQLPTPWLSDVDPLLLAGGFLYTTAFESDAVVDGNGNLHVVVAIGPRPGGPDGAFSISTAYGNWGVFDIYTTDGGTTWFGKLLDKPQTFRGSFGVSGDAVNPLINEDSRPQASRTWDGSKVFFTWFDTDTAIFGVTTNTFPDAHSIGYDLTGGMWTDVINLTAGTNADGRCTFGNVSYYVIETGGSFNIPIVFGELVDPLQTGSPMSFHYVDAASVSTFNQPGGEVALSTYYDRVPTIAGVASFSVSANYPNPFTGKTSVDVHLVKASDVTVEVCNMVGQVLSTTNYINQPVGNNTLTIDAANLAKGLYMYKVKVGAEVVTKTMSIQ